MADNAKEHAPQAISTVRIARDIPVIFADGVISQNWGPGISKFYFGRIDADPDATGDPSSIPVAQIVMPADGFASMVTFFEHRLKTMIKNGIISQEAVDKSRNAWVIENP